MTTGRDKRVLRVQGSSRAVAPELRREQWISALFAYAELHHNPSLQVPALLERQRTVPASRWRSHRLLLDAHAVLLCGCPRERVQQLRLRAARLIELGASYEAVEHGLGEYQSLDAERLVAECPFFRSGEIANTYWEGWVAEPESLESPAGSISVRLCSLRDCEPERSFQGERSLVVVCGHVLAGEAAADTWRAAFEKPQHLEVCYSFWSVRLRPSGADGLLETGSIPLLDALLLTAGRAAWAVGVQVFEGDGPTAKEVEQVLGAAVELTATLAVGHAELTEQPWQLPIMSAAQLAQESVVAVLEAFAGVGAGIYERSWRAASDPCLFDSKYLYVAAPASAPKRMALRIGRYETTLQIAIGDESGLLFGMDETDPDATTTRATGRWSMMRLIDPRHRRDTGA